MKTFFIRSAAFSIFFLGTILILVYLTSALVRSRGFKVYNTDSNNLVMGKNEHFGIILSGASHARNLSRFENNLRMEKILERSITNIGQGAASCGLNEQYFYLRYFYEQGNTVDKLVYMLSPPLLFSEDLPFASNTFNYEYFSIGFLTSYLKFDSENKRQRIFEYIRSKLMHEWIYLYPKTEEANNGVLVRVDSAAAKAGAELFYMPENSEQRFEKSCKIIEDEILFSREHNTEIVFVFPPAVFGKWPGHEKTVEFTEKMKKKYGIRYYDYSESIMDPKYYYDHHHLNTSGVVYFTENFLKPIL